MEELLGITKNGVYVYDRKNSHFHEEGGLTKDLLKEAIEKIEFRKKVGSVRNIVVNMDKVIGKTSCVSLYKDDHVIYVYRKGRIGRTPMVKNRDPEDCDSVTVVLKKIAEDEAIMLTGYIGKGSPREPWDRSLSHKARAEAIYYWRHHALVWNNDLIDWDRTKI